MASACLKNGSLAAQWRGAQYLSLKAVAKALQSSMSLRAEMVAEKKVAGRG